MAFPDDLEWNQPGVEPTQAKKDEGWKPEEKPPAEYFNWFFNRTSQAVKYLKGESDKLIDDAKIGNRTITDTVTAAPGAGTITNLLSKIGNMIKRITGKSNWYTAPATTLQALSDLIVLTPGANKLLKLDANSKLPADITGNSATATKLATARKINTVPFDGSADINLTPANIGAAPDGFGLGRAAATATGDWNNYTDTGFFMGNALVNSPIANNWWWWVEVIRHNNLYVYQQAHKFATGTTATTITYERSMYGGVWQEWKQLATTDLVAPAGYGLGTTANNYTGDIDKTAWETGFYYVRITATGTKPYDYGHMIVMVESAASTIKQIWLTNVTNDMQIRQCVNGVWSAWKQIATMDAVAPAGYGLGGYATNVTDANLAVLSGFYKINGASSGGKNIPTETGSSTAYIFVEAMDNANVKQTLFNRNNGNIYVRHMFVNVWSAWKQIATTGQIPIMTALIDWSTMATKAGVSSVKNLNNTGSGISAYGGDSRNLGNGDIYLKQSYKNFDAILVVGTNDNADFLMTYKWEKWELEFMFNQQYRFNLFNAGSYAAYWDVWCSKLAGTAHPQSTEIVWYNQAQNGGIVEIYGLNY